MSNDKQTGLDWRAVVEQTASWLVIGAICGVAWLSWHVPRQLDRIIQNQERLASDATELKGRFQVIEANDRQQEARLIKLEAKR